MPQCSVQFVLVLVSLIFLGALAKEECTCSSSTSQTTKAYVKTATSGLLGAFGTSALGSSTVGFTVAGIAKGSLAAYIQAKLGIFGGFSVLQSLGAKGMFALGGPVGIGIGAALAGVTLYTAWGTGEGDSGCSCADTETATQEELEQLMILKSVESCVEPYQPLHTSCNSRGTCHFDKVSEEMSCKCKSPWTGVYCEIPSEDNPEIPSKSRCEDKFIHGCVTCWIDKLTRAEKRNCYQSCVWSSRPNPDTNHQSNNLRPDVGGMEVKHVLKLSVYQGTPCRVPLNGTCDAQIRYTYEHTEDHLDQLIVYVSANDLTCSDNHKTEL